MTGRRLAALLLFDLVVLAIVSALLALALWQIQRRTWKLDLIARVEDCKIPGCPGGTVKSLMDKEAGQTLRLTIQREGQAEREVVITLGKKSS